MKKQIKIIMMVIFVMTLMITGCQSDVMVEEEAPSVPEIEQEVEAEEIQEPVLG